MAPGNHRKATATSSADELPAAGASTTDNSPEMRWNELGNLYQYKGSRKGFEAGAADGGLYLRIDMPGVEDDAVDFWREGKELFFHGEAEKQMEFEEKRVYGGSIDLSSNPREITEVKALMRNGVFRLAVAGCTIKPDLSNMRIPSSSTLSSNATRDGSNGIYPFQLDGPKESFEMRVLDCDHLFMRVDMPDVPSHGSTVKLRDNMLLFGGDGGKGFEHDRENRGYFGKLPLPCGCCKYIGFTSNVSSGVLRMVIEKRKIEGQVCKFCKQ